MNNLLSDIRLKDHEIKTANDAHEHLTEVLHGKGRDGLLPTPQNIFLVGSFLRGTKITPLDDIDIFYVIGNAENRDGIWHTITNCSFPFGLDYYDADRNLSSVKILELLKREIDKTYGQSEIRRSGEVVNLHLESYGMGFDIVPVFDITNTKYYLMPNGGGSTKWKKSNPLIDQQIIDTLDNQHNNLIKDVIILTKYWFQKKKIVSPRPYHLEATAYHVLTGLPQPITTHAEGLTLLLGRINLNNYLTQCPDPTGLSEPISSGLSSEDIQNIVTEAYEAMVHLQNGNQAFIDYVEGQ